MHQITIKRIVDELNETLPGRFAGKIFQLSPFSLAIDFRIREGRYLFLSVDPKNPRIYLIERRLRELEKQSLPLSPFGQAMRSSLGGGNLIAVTKDESERIVRLRFSVRDETGDMHTRWLVAQLTGRSANLLLLDDSESITHALRQPKGTGQQINEQYVPPPSQAQRLTEEQPLDQGDFPTLSAALDHHFTQLASAEAFASRVRTIGERLQKEISQQQKLKANLKADLKAHGSAEEHKRAGELLLANIANAIREGRKVTITDYFSEDQASIEIEVDENLSLQEEAARRFNRYTKSKRAAEEISDRLVEIDRKLIVLGERLSDLKNISATGDEAALASFAGEKEPARKSVGKPKPAEKLPGVRSYRSSDGYEILVGRAARTNDQLTFRVARPSDLWLHAADYPGSHVIIRSQGRSEFPQRTIIEAAQLAAKFSQASADSKVTIHYTQRKFLSKPKGAAPGLVRMSSFRTITVEPKENVERIY